MGSGTGSQNILLGATFSLEHLEISNVVGEKTNATEQGSLSIRCSTEGVRTEPTHEFMKSFRGSAAVCLAGVHPVEPY